MICLGEPSILLMKFENPLFFLCALKGLSGWVISPDVRLGFIVPVSDLGGVISTGVLLLPLDMFPDNLNSPNLKSGEVYV